eukprot:TCALIF_02989-PA protein Name:"Protein of unknown function" AED:0.08 eAED:0.08 QI:310/1/0.66/1/1/0.66/3/0/116
MPKAKNKSQKKANMMLHVPRAEEREPTKFQMTYSLPLTHQARDGASVRLWDQNVPSNIILSPYGHQEMPFMGKILPQVQHQSVQPMVQPTEGQRYPILIQPQGQPKLPTQPVANST